MPYLSKERRAQGGFAPVEVEPWPDHDWSVPTDAATLQHRVLPTPDQSRYGHATGDPPRYGVDGRPLKGVPRG